MILSLLKHSWVYVWWFQSISLNVLYTNLVWKSKPLISPLLHPLKRKDQDFFSYFFSFLVFFGPEYGYLLMLNKIWIKIHFNFQSLSVKNLIFTFFDDFGDFGDLNKANFNNLCLPNAWKTYKGSRSIHFSPEIMKLG